MHKIESVKLFQAEGLIADCGEVGEFATLAEATAAAVSRVRNYKRTSYKFDVTVTWENGEVGNFMSCLIWAGNRSSKMAAENNFAAQIAARCNPTPADGYEFI